MFEHVKLVHSRCPLLSAYIEAQKANRERDRGTTDETQQPQPSQSLSPVPDSAPQASTVTAGTNELDAKAKLETLSDDLEKLKLEEEQLRVQQEAQIRTLLNQQTAIQFRQYAQEQHPNDTKKQDELVRQLQQQHFQQYMTQVLKQQIEHQKQQARQIAALLRQQRKQQNEQAASTSEQLADGAAAGAGAILIVDESNEEAAGSSRAPPNGSHALEPLGASATVVPAAELTLPTGTDDVESNVDDAGAETELSDESYDDNEAGSMPYFVPHQSEPPLPRFLVP